MNSEIGNQVFSSPHHSDFKLGGVVIHPMDATIPHNQLYRALTNKTGAEVILAGANLLAHIKETCGTLDVGSVVARMTFIPA